LLQCDARGEERPCRAGAPMSHQPKANDISHRSDIIASLAPSLDARGVEGLVALVLTMRHQPKADNISQRSDIRPLLLQCDARGVERPCCAGACNEQGNTSPRPIIYHNQPDAYLARM
jgi:hypothetical protein